MKDKHFPYQVAIMAMIVLMLISCKNMMNKNRSDEMIETFYVDSSVDPGKDFYRFANAGWLKNTEIPEDYSRYGVFEELMEKNQEDLKYIFELTAEKNHPNGSKEQKMADFYLSGLDTVSIESQGKAPLDPIFTKINDLVTEGQKEALLAYLHEYQINAFFNLFVGQDAKSSQDMILNLYQGGLGLPDRDYYFSEDSRSENIRGYYRAHLGNMFQSIELNNYSEQIYMLEEGLAGSSMTRLERRDPYNTYHKMPLDSLQELAPDFDWAAYFHHLGIDNPGGINVGQPEFFKTFNRIIRDISQEELKAYAKINVMRKAAPYLNAEIEQEHFDFYGRKLSGKQKQRPRWKRVISATNNYLGELVGQVYVEHFFPPESKARMEDMIKNLKASLHERIQGLTWMSEETKKEALAKLEVMNVKIGYPDSWKDYSSLQVSGDSYIANVMEGRKFDFHDNLSKLGKKVDPDEWHMYPQTVNAYYNPYSNEIVFPAAILQPPFFNMAADDAVNYGAIGVVIGHEMTHGFDDMGRKFSKEGNLENWWTKEDEERFNERTRLLVEQYNRFMVFDSLSLGVDGELTLGENIADVGGLKVAYHALLKAMGEETDEGNAVASMKESAVAGEKFADVSEKTAADPKDSAVDQGKTEADQRKAAADQGKTAVDQGKTEADQGKTAVDQGKTEADPKDSAVNQEKTAVDQGKTEADQRKAAADPKDSAVASEQSLIAAKKSAIKSEEPAIEEDKSTIREEKDEVSERGRTQETDQQEKNQQEKTQHEKTLQDKTQQKDTHQEKIQQEKIHGLTYQQRFFLSYANIWRQHIREEELMRRLREDVHSPGKYRVNGALFNIPEFYTAFQIDKEDPLYLSPEERAKIW